MDSQARDGKKLREEQVQKACAKAIRTGERKDLAEYLKIRRQ